MNTVYKVEGNKAILSDNPKEAIKNFELYLKTSKTIDVEILINLGFLYFKNKQISKAIKVFSDTIALAPSSYQAHYGLGAIAEENEELQVAIGHYLAALKQKSKHHASAYNLAGIYADLGEIKRAEKMYNQAIKADPENIWSYLGLARIYEIHGEYTKAKKLFLKALEANPNNGKVQYNLGENAYSRNEIEESIMWYKESINADWSFELAYVSLGVVYREQGRFLEAYNILKEGVKNYPKVGIIKYNLGCVANLLEFKEEALVNIIESIEIVPEFYDNAMEDNDISESKKEKIKAHF